VPRVERLSGLAMCFEGILLMRLGTGTILLNGDSWEVGERFVLVWRVGNTACQRLPTSLVALPLMKSYGQSRFS